MLEPTARHLFTDALRPPSGYTVDLAIGTTYSLDLSSLLLPPLAMAAHDRATGGEQKGPADTIALLEAVRRFADRTTVFCQAGAIHPPGSYRRVLAFAEDSVVEVAPTDPARVFHPKVWLLRFTDGSGLRHRLLCLSRNLTSDTSWDTLLVLDESEGPDGIDARPAGTFLQALPGLAAAGIAPAHRAQVQDMSASLGDVRFEVPTPFRSGELWPLGVGTDHDWPMPPVVNQSLTISPFLDATTVRRVRPRGPNIFVSRPVTYRQLGSATFDGRDVRVLDPLAEMGTADDEPAVAEADEPASSPYEVRSGLHAKTFVWDFDGSGWLFTGSANATSAAFGGNVEFSVLLRGPRQRCGVDALVPAGNPDRDQLVLGQILQEHTIGNEQPEPDPRVAAEMDIAAFHTALVAAGPHLRVVRDDPTERYDAHLDFAAELPLGPGTTTVRLVSREARHHAHRLGRASWPDLGLLDLTLFVAVQTTVVDDDLPDPVTLACVIKADLVDAPENRTTEVLRSFLDSEESVVRYLAFLLDDAGGGIGWDGQDPWGPDAPGGGSLRPPTFDDLALLEVLLRAAARGDASLKRVEVLLRDLGARAGRDGVVSQEFFDVWSAVWEAAREKERV